MAMFKIRSAVDAARADEEVTDEMIDAQWQRLAKPHSGMAPMASERPIDGVNN